MKLVILACVFAAVSGYSIERVPLPETHGQLCDMCIDTLEFFKDAATAEEVEKLVTDISEATCELLVPAAYRDECMQLVVSIVSKNFATIHDFVLLFPPAEICKIVHFCPRNELEVDVGFEKCTFCVDNMEVFRTLATSPELEEVITAYADKACNASSLLKPFCDKAVDYLIARFFTGVRDTIGSLTDRGICEDIWMCTANVTRVATPAPSVTCHACRSSIDELELLLTSDQAEGLISYLAEYACEVIPFGGMKKQCRQILHDKIEDSFNQIRHLLTIYDAETLCEFVHFCESKGKLEIEVGFEKCSFCVENMETLKQLLLFPELEQVFKSYAEKACLASGRLKPFCVEAVDYLVGRTFTGIRTRLQNITDAQICEKIWMCTVAPQWPYTAAVAAPAVSVCDVCKSTVQEVEGLILMDEVEATVVDIAHFSCDLIPTQTLSNMCREFTEDSIEEVFYNVRELLKKYDADKVCKITHFCRKSDYELELAAVTPQWLYTAAVAAPAVSVCDVCKSTVQEVEGLILMDEVEATVVDIAHFSCDLIPTQTLSDMCREFTEDSIEEVFYNVRELLKKYDADKVCKMTHFCKKSGYEQELAAHIANTPVSDICVICEDSLNMWRGILTDKALEQMVNTDVKYVCKFAGFFHKTCEGYVDAFTQQMWNIIREAYDQFDDHKTCIVFDFCSDDANGTTVCDVCTNSFEKVKAFVTSDSLEKLIKKEVDIACIAFGPFRRFCISQSEVVIEVAISLIHVMLDDIHGDAFCRSIHMCKRHPMFDSNETY